MRKSFKSNVRFMLMNSFSTSEDTLEFLKKYPELANDPNLELVQVCPSVHPARPLLPTARMLFISTLVCSSDPSAYSKTQRLGYPPLPQTLRAT